MEIKTNGLAGAIHKSILEGEVTVHECAVVATSLGLRLEQAIVQVWVTAEGYFANVLHPLHEAASALAVRGRLQESGLIQPDAKQGGVQLPTLPLNDPQIEAGLAARRAAAATTTTGDKQ